MPIETTSDRSFVCMVCAEWRSPDKNAVCETCGISLSFGSELVGEHLETYTLSQYVGRGVYGATFKAQNRIGKPFALKLCPVRLYLVQERDFDGEIQRYNTIGSHPNIAELLDAGTTHLTVLGRRVTFHYIVMEWVEGLELSAFVRTQKLTAAELYSIARGLTSGVARLEAANLWHN